MRLGRLDVAAYSDRFDVPAAGPGGLAVTFLGVASLIHDGSSALMIDGFFSSRRSGTVALRTISPDLPRIEAGRRVVLTHWDDFFRLSDQPLRALHFPTIWRREDPWVA